MAGAKPSRKTSRRIEIEPHLLAIDANFEPVSKAAFEYRQKKVYPYLKSKGFKKISCQGKLARRIYVASEALSSDVVYITGVGHGSYVAYTGDFYDPIFDVGHYQKEEVLGKVVHLLSCQTAAKLGPDFVQKGCRAYFGYDENFVFMMDYATIFFQCDAEIDRAFADGLNAGQVYKQTVALFDQKIAAVEAAGHDYVAATLAYNRNHLRAPSVDRRWGDEKAKIV